MEALQSQMNPHFIFNALNSIKHFILTNEKFKAAEYLSGFSSLVRQVLNNSKSPIINLEKEIETLKLYIEMEQMRFDDKFNYQFHIDGNLDLLEINLPPLIFQPYVENAIWHGLMHKEGPRKLDIYFKKLGDSLLCTIEDNGIGRKKAMESKPGGLKRQKSFGMQITQDRMKINQIKSDINIIDKENDNGIATGTKVIIQIPLNQLKN
jgi:LytS/YehU family sensor histidine kinase